MAKSQHIKDHYGSKGALHRSWRMSALHLNWKLQNFMSTHPGRLSRPARRRPAKHAAIDHELSSRYVAGGIGGQIQDAVGDVARLAGAPQRGSQLCKLRRIHRRVRAGGSRRKLTPDRRVDNTGMDRVDPDAVAD